MVGVRKLISTYAVSILLAVGGSGLASAGPLEDAHHAYEQRDYITALTLLQPLADQGDAVAQLRLGAMYAFGQGVPEYLEAALYWFHRSAVQGDPTAQYNIGMLYAEGEGVRRDKVQAYKWLSLAAAHFPSEEADHRDHAIKNRDAMAATMTGDQIAEAERLTRDWLPNSRTDRLPTTCTITLHSPLGGTILAETGLAAFIPGIPDMQVIWQPPASGKTIELDLGAEDIPIGGHARVWLRDHSQDRDTEFVFSDQLGREWRFAGDEIKPGTDIAGRPFADATFLEDRPGMDRMGSELLAAIARGGRITVTVNQRHAVVAREVFDVSNISAREELVANARAMEQAADPKVCTDRPPGLEPGKFVVEAAPIPQ
jgi:hypothetical protein